MLHPSFKEGTFNAGLMSTEAGTLGRFTGNALLTFAGNLAGLDTRTQVVLLLTPTLAHFQTISMPASAADFTGKHASAPIGIIMHVPVALRFLPHPHSHTCMQENVAATLLNALTSVGWVCAVNEVCPHPFWHDGSARGLEHCVVLAVLQAHG